MSAELLPCPFCGRAPEMEDWSDHHGEYWHLYCKTEGCAVSPYTEGDNKAKLLDGWNRRAQPPASTPVIQSEDARMLDWVQGNWRWFLLHTNPISKMKDIRSAIKAAMEGEA